MAPGRAFCVPETTIRSPSLRPSVTIHSGPVSASTTTRFWMTLSSGPTVSTYGPVASRCRPACGTRNPWFTAPELRRTPTNMPGSS